MSRGSAGRSECPGWPIFTSTSCRRGCCAGYGGTSTRLGSDFPNIPYPYTRQLAGLARLGLGEDWLRAVCWDNPVAMFGLPPSAQVAG
jgi:hypothetical protein